MTIKQTRIKTVWLILTYADLGTVYQVPSNTDKQYDKRLLNQL